MSDPKKSDSDVPKDALAEEFWQATESVQDSLCTVTFYSFKGGVGRTLALLNVATLLAKLGNRVVIADFDLEAPGLDTYKGFEPPTDDQPGILEFITDYTNSKTLSAPSCKDYLYCVFDKGLHRSRDKNTGSITSNGALYVMRAGRQDAKYRESLAKLNWDKLFAEQDGHLLFANLKNELFEDYGCSFLLLDSRTGLTDVAGVCTAFLPDAVILMFYPDEQNTRGIKTVANAIRKFERSEHRLIPRMYCVSRVPQVVQTRQEAEKMASDVYLESEFGPKQAAADSSLSKEERNRIKQAWEKGYSGSWDWNSYELTSGYIIHQKPHLGIRAMIAQTMKDGFPEDLYELGEVANIRGLDSSFGGAPICLIPERLSIHQDLVARCSDVHGDDNKPYMNLASFTAVNNILEWHQLYEQTNVLRNKKGFQDHFDLGDWEYKLGPSGKEKWTTVSIDSIKNLVTRKRIEYARKWQTKKGSFAH